MIGTIKVNSNTKQHAANLRSFGYEVTEGSDGLLRVEVTGFVTSVDVSCGVSSLREVISLRQALTYSTKVIFPEGTFQSLPACLKLAGLSKKAGLPNLSCLIMKNGEGKASREAAPIVDIAAWLRG